MELDCFLVQAFDGLWQVVVAGGSYRGLPSGSQDPQVGHWRGALRHEEQGSFSAERFSTEPFQWVDASWSPAA